MRYFLYTLAVLAVLVIAGYFAQSKTILCPTEDSTHCVWIPAIQGNGQGQPTIVVNVGEK